ncbi:GNAT family N-acetyltransferase [Streptomyces sp. NPDC049954]|uniref:GNAT family N-acetyltransferase n=1 Tax=Streptomyces sp. NPDC049954 TaxID=3155779 RepID=UPI00344835AC
MDQQSPYEIRPIRAEEWRKVKELRLAALQDPVAHLAFLETTEEALARPDVFWKDRAARSSTGLASRQFVAVDAQENWVGTVTGIVEDAGGLDFFGNPVEERQVQIVGVYVRPGQRGTGLLGGLFRAAVDWATGIGVRRIRLFVHEDNGRAAAAYRKLGFVPTGVRVVGDHGNELEYVRKG